MSALRCAPVPKRMLSQELELLDKAILRATLLYVALELLPRG
jgi:hypothetical protein